MTTLSCQEVRAQLLFYPRADLSPALWHLMTIHLQSCPACRCELAAVQEVHRHIEAYLYAAPDGDVEGAKQAIMARLEALGPSMAQVETPHISQSLARLYRMDRIDESENRRNEDR